MSASTIMLMGRGLGRAFDRPDLRQELEIVLDVPDFNDSAELDTLNVDRDEVDSLTAATPALPDASEVPAEPQPRGHPVAGDEEFH